MTAQRITILILSVLMAAALACSSDPEGPVTSIFLEESTYTTRPGETIRYIDTLQNVTVIDVPTGIGSSSLLRLGETKGIRFESVLMKFDFDSLGNHAGKTVDSAFFYLPVTIVQDTIFHLGITFNELLEDFSEDDTLTSTPAFSASPIEGPAGETVRDINIERNSFAIDESLAQAWIDGSIDPWPYGVAVNWAAVPDTLGIIEMKSQNYGSDPPVLKVWFTDASEAVFPVEEDYTITSYNGSGLACVGGVATRIYFEFDLGGIEEDATVHYSALVLNVNGSEGLGATGGEILIGFSSDFIYYLYTPDSGDPLLYDFFEGTGVATNAFIPTLSDRIRIPLGGFTADVLEGLRENTGLVLQSNLENVRYQKALFHGIAAGDSLRPYLEVIYSLPAGFGGE